MSGSIRVGTEVGELQVDLFGDDSAPPVVLWPSLYCTGAIWGPQIEALAPRFRLVVVDPPGHGRSGPPPARFSLDATARATVEILDVLNIDEAAIVGGAWGGMVGVQMASLTPSRVTALVLINSPLDRWRGWARVEMHALAQLIQRGGPKAVAGLLAKNMLTPGVRRDHPERSRQFREALLAMDRRSLYASARSAMLDRPSLLPLLGDLTGPVLVIAGADDGFCPLTRARVESSAIRGRRFEVIEGSSHLSAFEAPELVNPLLLEFLFEAWARAHPSQSAALPGAANPKGNR